MSEIKETGSNGYDYHEQLHVNDDADNALRKIRTAGSVNIPPELFEKLYLNPQTRFVKDSLSKRLGNPTPIGLIGFLLSLSPLSFILMDFRDTAVGAGASNIPVYFFVGGVLMSGSGFFELILGNTFVAVVFVVFGAFWLSFGGLLQPFYGAYAAFAEPGEPASTGLAAPAFNNGFGFFLLFMGVVCLIFLVCTLRTNLVLFMIIFFLVLTFFLLTAFFFYTANGDTAMANSTRTAGGAMAFIACIFGWYLFTALLLASVDFPIALPVFDLSTKIKGASAKEQV